MYICISIYIHLRGVSLLPHHLRHLLHRGVPPVGSQRRAQQFTQLKQEYTGLRLVWRRVRVRVNRQGAPSAARSTSLSCDRVRVKGLTRQG